MYTFTHPLAPTVRYEGDLGQSIASYACDHLHEFDVFLAEAQSATHGLAMEVFEKATGKPLGLVAIH